LFDPGPGFRYTAFMSRRARQAVGGPVYHVLNRGNLRAPVFYKDRTPRPAALPVCRTQRSSGRPGPTRRAGALGQPLAARFRSRRAAARAGLLARGSAEKLGATGQSADARIAAAAHPPEREAWPSLRRCRLAVENDAPAGPGAYLPQPRPATEGERMTPGPCIHPPAPSSTPKWLCPQTSRILRADCNRWRSLGKITTAGTFNLT